MTDVTTATMSSPHPHTLEVVAKAALAWVIMARAVCTGPECSICSSLNLGGRTPWTIAVARDRQLGDTHMLSAQTSYYGRLYAGWCTMENTSGQPVSGTYIPCARANRRASVKTSRLAVCDIYKRNIYWCTCS